MGPASAPTAESQAALAAAQAACAAAEAVATGIRGRYQRQAPVPPSGPTHAPHLIRSVPNPTTSTTPQSVAAQQENSDAGTAPMVVDQTNPAQMPSLGFTASACAGHVDLSDGDSSDHA